MFTSAVNFYKTADKPTKKKKIKEIEMKDEKVKIKLIKWLLTRSLILLEIDSQHMIRTLLLSNRHMFIY